MTSKSVGLLHCISGHCTLDVALVKAELKVRFGAYIKISLETAARWCNGTDEELKALALQTYPELSKEDLPKNEDEIKNIENLLSPELKEIYSDIRQYTFCELVHLNKIDEEYEKYYLSQLETTINILKAFYFLNQMD